MPTMAETVQGAQATLGTIGDARTAWGGARLGDPKGNVLQYTCIYVTRARLQRCPDHHGRYCKAVDRVSHANGWSFHSDLPGLTRDVNVDTEHRADTRGERGSRSLEP